MTSRSLGISRLVVFGDSLSDNGNLFRLLEFPRPPYWHGHFSNGPTYVEQLAKWLRVPLDDRAFGGADASNSFTPLPINLPDQVAGYIDHLRGHVPPPGTTAVINIGSNDYETLLDHLPHDQATIDAFVADVVQSVGMAIDALTKAGVGRIILFTLPDLAIAPEVRSRAPDIVAAAHEVIALNNAALAQMAAGHANIEMVDIFRLSDTLFADPKAFGFYAPANVTWLDLLAAHPTAFAPDEVAFFDGLHPTAAAHGILAAFTEAELAANDVQLLDGTRTLIDAGNGDSFIFATPIDRSQPGLSDNYTIHGGRGNDVIFAGSGHVTVYGGKGADLIAAGSGDAYLKGGIGSDLLETSSRGSNTLIAGHGEDILIANRAGHNVLVGGRGDDLFILKESVIGSHGRLVFGRQEIVGGSGENTLRIIINDQHPQAMAAAIAEFEKIEAAFERPGWRHGGHASAFTVDGLHVRNIDRIELQLDSVSSDPNTPYLITHRILIADGDPAAPLSASINHLLQTAEHWNLLTV
jgi:phospholipase/lecithinase/hemolysin